MNFNPKTETEEKIGIDIDEIPYEDMHPFLQELIDEHHVYTKELNAFEEAVAMIESGKVDREVDEKLRQFFSYFDDQIVSYDQEGEKYLFVSVSKKMITDENFNVIEFLEADHVKSIQMAAITFNMLALFSRVPDKQSRFIVLDVALKQAKELIELLRVHIYREDTMIFPYAQRNFTHEELTEIQQRSKS
ncbi:hemerythrin domain-containing protein [Sulfurovum sp.]|uniref:hemerythrin domain-containing protein n=1 Tax=Sulfurovum sp. TaxID=1969726 RepID=UPI00356A54DC